VIGWHSGAEDSALALPFFNFRPEQYYPVSDPHSLKHFVIMPMLALIIQRGRPMQPNWQSGFLCRIGRNVLARIDLSVATHDLQVGWHNDLPRWKTNAGIVRIRLCATVRYWPP